MVLIDPILVLDAAMLMLSRVKLWWSIIPSTFVGASFLKNALKTCSKEPEEKVSIGTEPNSSFTRDCCEFIAFIASVSFIS